MEMFEFAIHQLDIAALTAVHAALHREHEDAFAKAREFGRAAAMTEVRLRQLKEQERLEAAQTAPREVASV